MEEGEEEEEENCVDEWKGAISNNSFGSMIKVNS